MIYILIIWEDEIFGEKKRVFWKSFIFMIMLDKNSTFVEVLWIMFSNGAWSISLIDELLSKAEPKDDIW